MDKKKLITYATYIGIGIIVLVLVFVVGKYIKSKVSGAFSQAQQDYVNSLEITNSEVHLSDAQLQALVAKLKTAFGKWGWGTDEEMVYSVFETLSTRSDLLALVKKFGVVDGHTLNEWMNKELSTSELEHIQSLLTSKGIVYVF